MFYQRVVDGEIVEFTIDGVNQLGKSPPPPPMVIKSKWPVILQPMRLLAQPQDKGLGDIIARTIGPLGGEAFKDWYKRLFGRDCNCNARQEAWNAMYPL